MTEIMAEQVRAHLTIEGRVQGVFFRVHTREQARTAGVSGWVRNRDAGYVEAILEGPRAAVERVIAWCHTGPPHARVDRVAVQWETPMGEQGFFIR